MESITTEREECADEVYSNLSHELNTDVVTQLEDERYYAQHSAWNFCGRVYKDGIIWKNEISRQHLIAATLEASSAHAVIALANERYGDN